MELILLLLLGGLAAGAGLWAASGKKDGGAAPSAYSPPGREPASRPDRASGPGAPPSPGEPVVHGDPFQDMLKNAPKSVQARVPGEEKKKSQHKPKEPSGPLEVTYGPDDIIPPNSQYAFQRRPLKNAEALIEKSKADEAVSLYEKIKNRIPDSDIKSKIDQNIQDIRKWQQGGDDEDEGLPGDGGYRFPEIIVPITPQLDAMQSLADGLKSIAEELGGKMAEALMNLQKGPGGESGKDDLLGEITSLQFKGAEEEDKPEGYGIDENGNVTTDGWSDEDFEREWEKFKDLPLKDRRKDDRRAGDDRREGGEDLRKDRRDDTDRRQNDLFNERDDFLEKLERHKKNKMLHDMEKKREEEKKKKPKAKIDLSADVEVEDSAVLSGRESLAEAAAKEEEPEFEEKRQPPEKKPGEKPEEEKAETKPGEKPEEEKTEAKPGEKPEEEKAETKPGEKPEDEKAEKKPGEKPEEEKAEAKPGEKPEEEKAEAKPGEKPEEEKAEAKPGEKPRAEKAAAAAEEEDDWTEARDGLGEGVAGASEIPDLEDEDFEEDVLEQEKPPPIQEIKGVLELKPPEEDDAPFLTLTYDFSKIPDSFKLSRDYHTMEYVYYKYKPMLVKAQEFTRRKMLKNALNYYRVIKSQRIPPEFKRMINRNIQDITEYLEKFLMRRS